MPPSNLDLFSKQASLYSKFRPTYPPALFDLVLGLARGRDLAWDVGTGNGQAACELAAHFKSVVATDVSSSQISHATLRSNIRYETTPAVMDGPTLHELVAPPDSVDLVTVAQALHWFDFDNFFGNVRRVLKKDTGVVAAWSYGLCSVSPAVDAALEEFYKESHPFWEPQRVYIEEGYRTIPFDFSPLPGRESMGTGPVEISSACEWNLPQFIGLIESWSAVQTARDKGIELLTDKWRHEFERAWGNSPSVKKTVVFPVSLLLGCVPSSS